jgi:hypothetical protein
MYFNKFLRYALFLSIVSTAVACGTGKKLGNSRVRDEVNLTNVPDDQIRMKLEQNVIQAEWWQAKAKVLATIDGDHYSLQATFKIQRGKLIWMSLRKLGLEVARVYITPDSTVVINRMESTYQIERSEDLSNKIGFPLDMVSLEKLFLGHPVLSEKLTYPDGLQKDSFSIHGISDNWLSVHTVSLPTWQISQSSFRLKNESKELKANFSQYQPIKDNKFFPYLRVYEFKEHADDPSVVEIQFSEIQPDAPFEVHLEIPGRYTRI